MQVGKSLTISVFGEMQKFTVATVKLAEQEGEVPDEETKAMDDATADSTVDTVVGIPVVTEQT